MATLFQDADNYIEYSMWTGEVRELMRDGKLVTENVDWELARWAHERGWDEPDRLGLRAWVARLYEIGYLPFVADKQH
jgi:hypothetical protein